LLATGCVRISWLPSIFTTSCLFTWLRYPIYFTVCVHAVLLFCYTEGNSGSINSDDSDMRYMVYIRGLPCLDYYFDVSISWIQSLSHTCIYQFTWCLRLCLCAYAHNMIFDICLPIEFIDTRVFTCARHLTLSYVLVGLFSDNSGVACLDLRVWNLWILHIAD